MGFLPYAWQDTAPLRAIDSSVFLPSYLLQHRNPNGTVSQTLSIASPISVADKAATRVPDKVPPHSFTVTVTHPASKTSWTFAGSAPSHLIHEHAANQQAVSMSKSRTNVGAAYTTYWAVADRKLAVPICPGVNQVIGVEFTKAGSEPVTM
jgi:hypothetical protein